MPVVLLALLVIGVRNIPASPTFDLIEVNTVVCGERDETQLRFTQVIAWSWCPSLMCFRCEGYRVVDAWQRTRKGVRYLEGSGRQWGEVNGVVRVTQTRHDPEMQDRARFPIQNRLWK